MKSPKGEHFDVAVIGGGAAGLMCACTCAENGADCALFEKNKSQKKLSSENFYDNAYLGKKLLITGKGRCNLTNDCTSEEFMKNVPRNAKFLYSAFGAFPPSKVMDFFEDCGVALKVERGNRVFPESDKALDILIALKRRLRDSGCGVYNSEIRGIAKTDSAFTLTTAEGETFTADKVVVCTGGLSYPITGSTGDGYRFAESFGHTVVTPKPSLVPLVSNDDCIRSLGLQGLSLKNVKLTVYKKSGEKNKKIYSEQGEMLFTHFGMSGPLVLSASAHIDSPEEGEYFALIDLKPALDEKTLDARVLSDFGKYINKNLANALVDLLPRSMIPAVIEKSGLSSEEKPNGISKAARHTLVETLKNFCLSIDGFAPIDEAIITSGGVKTSEINPSSMESKLVSGLYFAGEVIDVDGYTGGFNLQIAFSTGYLAGANAAKNNEP